MEEFKGTQGDWKAVNTVGNNFTIEVKNTYTEIIANVTGENNAQIMAASKELLKELEGAYNTINHMLPDVIMGEGAKDVVRVDQRKRLKVIKKALK